MATLRLCKDCGRSIIVYSTLQTRCPKCTSDRKKPKQQKPIKQVGKEGDRYNVWLHAVARPYLDNKFGRNCSVCATPPPVDEESGMVGYNHVDHIEKRGSHPSKKYDVKNIRFLCPSCHEKVT